MTRIEGIAIVPAPLPEVFRYASDWRRWADWFEGVSNFKPTTHVLRGNGARYAYTARLMGFSTEVETEITGFVEGRGWMGVARRGMPHTTYWLFEPVGVQTRFTYVLDYRLGMPIMGHLMDNRLKSEWHRIVKTSLTRLCQRFQARETRGVTRQSSRRQRSR